MDEEREQQVRPAEESKPDEPPEAAVHARSGFSLVWLIPIVAALIGGWLAYRALSERGPTITITFKSGEGLEAGKTKVKFRDIEIGIVDSVTLAEDLSHVVVTAELVRGANRYLTENTRFWVVRAQITAGRVSGIGTVFSGAYIGVDPVLDGRQQRHFTGLDVAPIVTTGEPGRHFTLRSQELGSVEVGSPVYYRSIRVGQVVAYELDESGESVTVKVFVEAPHDQRVRQNTRFWNASGLDLSLDAEGIRLDSPSFVSMLIGGIAFDTPKSLEPETELEEGHVFVLYPNRRATREQTYTLRRRFLLYFQGSVQGLVPGSPVVFRGIKIGRVVDLKLEFDSDALDFYIPVLIELETERIEETGVETTYADERLVRLVERGLRAQLARGNLITGQLQVELDLHPEAPYAEVRFEGPYPELPTIPTPFEEITTDLARIVDRLDKVPLEAIGADLGESLQTLRTTLAKLDQTVESASTMLSPDSPTRRELQRALTELAGAARSVRLLADYLERNPEALLRGKEE